VSNRLSHPHTSKHVIREEKRRDDAARAWGSYFDDGHMKKNGVFK